MSCREILNDDGDDLGTKNISDNSSFSVQKSGDKEWTNNKRVPLKNKIECKVPHNILIMMRTLEKRIEEKLHDKLEFGCFLKGKFENGILLLTDDIMIVKQRVSSATIDFDEEPPDGYNGVIHRHPSGCSSFSGTDDKSINQNYDFSLLYHCNEISTGIINIELIGGVRIQLPLNITILYPIFNDNSIDSMVEKIEQKEMECREMSTNNRLLPGFDNNKNPLFNLETDEDEDEDNEGDVYVCPYCNNYERMSEIDFPYMCDRCHQIIQENEAIEIDDLPEDQIDRELLSKV